jgi:DNA-J related protein/DnaJ domain
MSAHTSSTQPCSQQFSTRLLEVLRAHSAGISEYALIKALEKNGESIFDSNCLRDNLSLFQTHFFLFHHLYQLREDLWRKREARLDISPLCIQLLPINDTPDTVLGEHDPLRDYYLQLGNLEDTNVDDVDTLLGQFWQRFVHGDHRQSALAELELQDPVDWTTIKTQHRRLAMQHHPDRGGDEQRLQAINAAMDVLARSNHHQ